jgi:predicted phosphoribosyltransferase
VTDIPNVRSFSSQERKEKTRRRKKKEEENVLARSLHSVVVSPDGVAHST